MNTPEIVTCQYDRQPHPLDDECLNVQGVDAVIDAAHLARQRAFSERTFGPGRRTQGILDHFEKEMDEIRRAPDDLGEWVDMIILGFDGAWRAGHEPQEIIDTIIAKQTRNEARRWPDWRTAEPGKAIEHDRTGEPESVDARQLLEQARQGAGRCEGRVVAYADGRTARCTLKAGHDGECA